MVIAVNTLSFLNDPEGTGRFIYELFSILAKKQSEHQFYLLPNREYGGSNAFSSNAYLHMISPQVSNIVLRKYWLDIKIPLFLKRMKADVLVSFDGCFSLSTKIPQCLVIADLKFLHHPEAFKKSHVRFLKRKMPRFLKKAKQAVCLSEFSKNDLLKKYKAEFSKIDVVYPAAKDVFKSLSWQEKLLVKEKYTEANEYFICAGPVHPEKNLVTLLKAFSIFKKRMQSGMKLLIAGSPGWKDEAFLKLVETYKYKTDVLVKQGLSQKDHVLLMGAAYALVYPSLFEGFGTTVMEAMKCHVPVLVSEKTSMAEISGHAALYFNPNEPADIADKLMTIYRDENLRNQLIEKGKERVQNYSLEKSAELLWQSILKTVGT